MRAFVLGAGGNLGAMQVGALRSLLERNIYPDLLVGCSVGGLNAAFVAQNLSLEGVERLKQMWLTVRLTDVYPDSLLGKAWRLLTGKDSLFDNQNFYRFLINKGLKPEYTFEDIQKTQLLITAANLQTGKLHVFGNETQERVIDALMATTALPPFHAPWEVKGKRYIDGGAVTCLPIRVAIERGATEIYVLRVEQSEQETDGLTRRGVVNVVRNSIHNMIRAHADYDLLLAKHTPGVRMHYVQLTAPEGCVRNTLKTIPSLIQRGFQMTEATFQPQYRLPTQEKSYAVESWPRLHYEGAFQSV
ncbi:MAG: patatin-like phospholipase family protein [Caldilineaceae bacterium]